MASFKITTFCYQSFWFYSSLWWERSVHFVGQVDTAERNFYFIIFYLQYSINMFWLLEKIENISCFVLFRFVLVFCCWLGFGCVWPLHGPYFPLPGSGYRCSSSACCMLGTTVPFVQKARPLWEGMWKCLHLEVVFGLLFPPVLMCQNRGFSHQYHFRGWTIIGDQTTLNNWHISWDTWQTNWGGKKKPTASLYRNTLFLIFDIKNCSPLHTNL